MVQKFLQGHWYKILPGGRKQQGVPQGAATTSSLVE